MIGVAPNRSARQQLRRTLTTTRSFRPLSDENRQGIRAHRLRIVEAAPGESLVDLGRRTGDAWKTARLPFHRSARSLAPTTENLISKKLSSEKLLLVVDWRAAIVFS